MCSGITLMQMLEPEASLEIRHSQLLFWSPLTHDFYLPPAG